MDSLSTQTRPAVPRPTSGTAAIVDSVLNVEVSCFANYKSPDNPQPVNLLRWLTSPKYQKEVETIRATIDKKQRNRLKSHLPAITPSGLFTRREASALVRHSELICLDIDYNGNENITNYASLKEQLCQLKNVAYCGQSVSGTGYFVLIPIAYPQQHGSQFRALQESFQNRFKVRIDHTPDVSRLRGYSYDPDAYFNHHASPFIGIYEELPTTPESDRPTRALKSNTFTKLALLRCIRLIEDAPDGQKHNQLNKAAYKAGRYIAGGVLDETEALAALEDAIRQKPNVADFRAAYRTIRDGIRDGKHQPIYLHSADTVPLSRVSQMGQPTFNSENRIWVGLTTTTDELVPPLDESLVDEVTRPDLTLEPDVSHLEYLVVEAEETYSTELAESKALGVPPDPKSSHFFEWQRTCPPFNQLGLASLLTKLNPGTS